MAVRSAIWNYFAEKEKDPNKTTFRVCLQDYYCKNGTTSSLINHLRSKHKDIYEKYLNNTAKRPLASPFPYHRKN